MRSMSCVVGCWVRMGRPTSSVLAFIDGSVGSVHSVSYSVSYSSSVAVVAVVARARAAWRAARARVSIIIIVAAAYQRSARRAHNRHRVSCLAAYGVWRARIARARRHGVNNGVTARGALARGEKAAASWRHHQSWRRGAAYGACRVRRNGVAGKISMGINGKKRHHVL